jgi:putative ABC transport system permease protein
MFINYFKTGFRNILKNGLQSGINVFGLALGLACVFLITVYVNHEMTYDQFFPDSENVYRITWESDNSQTRTPHPMAQAMVNDFPEVESAVSLSPYWAAGLTREIFSVRNLEKDIKFDERNALMVDSTFFDVFQLPIVLGDAKKALRSTNGILLSETAVKKYFGDDDPIGKHLAVGSDAELLEVMAVFKDIPERSHFHFDLLASYVREKSFDGDDEYYTWKDFGHFNYIRLKPGADPKELEAKLMQWSRKYIEFSDEFFRNALSNNIGFRVQPIKDIHLKSHLRWELEPNGNIEYVYIMVAAALLTLIIACINFMNLMTAKSAERAKEIGIRKTLGAFRRQLTFQFLSESILISLLAVGLSILIIEVSLPAYNSITGQNYTLNYFDPAGLLMLLGIGLVTGIIAGAYPSLVLSAIRPQSILKGKYMGSSQGITLRKVLLVAQFSISMALITGVAVIFNQLNFIRNKNLGFKKEEVLVIPLKNSDVGRRLDAVKSELLRIEGVTAVSASSNLPGGQFNQNSVFSTEHPEDAVDFSEAFVDYDFLKTMNVELADGRFFLPQSQADSGVAFVINEKGADQLHLENPVGKEIRWEAYGRTITGRVIGVMKDFHFQSLHESIQPLIFISYPSYNHLILKLDPANLETKLDQIKKVYATFDDSFEFEFAFLDDRLNKQYMAEERTGIIFASFASLAILIACFGLFAMAMLTFNQRLKEISIRKVLGASVSGLIFLLLNDFTKLILIAILIATPVAWWMMDRWLDNFIYQVGIHPMVFVISSLILLIISWITLSYFTLKTSRINPTETLKSE